MERVAKQLAFEKFKPSELEVPQFPFKFELGRRMVQELGSFIEGFIDPMTQTNTPKSMEEVVVEVMKANKASKLFQTMAIMSLTMGNLTLEVNTLKNILVVGEKEKAMLQEELDKEKDIQKGYKHSVEIWRKNMVEAKQKIKVLIRKLQDGNEELKSSTT
jgi:hypothetical protein